VRFGTVSGIERRLEGSGSWFRGSPQESCLIWEGVGKFLVRDAEEVIVMPDPGSEEGLAEAILGPVLSLVVQQKGWYPLHASTVLIGDSAVSIAGLSGSGKSSLAAALSTRGHAVVADDMTPVDTGVDPPKVRGGVPGLRLWPDTVASLGWSPRPYAEMADCTGKRRVAVPGHRRASGSLRRIYVIADGSENSITPMTPQEGSLRLVELCHCRSLIQGAIGVAGLIRHAAAIAGLVRIFRLTRRRSLTGLVETAAMVEEHAASDHRATTLNGHAPLLKP
jgi:hypothetical protein